MDRDILAEIERRRRLTKAFGRTTRGTYRQRFPKGFRQSMREQVLEEVARDRPKVIDRLLQLYVISWRSPQKVRNSRNET